MKFMSMCNDQVNYDEILIQLLLVLKHMFWIFLFMGYLRKKTELSTKNNII